MLSCAGVVLGLAAIIAAGEVPLTVLNGADCGGEPARMMERYLCAKADEALARRMERLEAIQTPGQFAEYQAAVRQFFIDRLGGFPERTPLNARVVGRIEGDGFRVEKVIYESRPKFYVTAALFLPVTEGPHPGVLVPCGHSSNGKASEVYQRACILLARNGIAALIYDPIGQGERAQILKPDGKAKHGSTFEHTLVGVGAMLVGHNTASYRIHDGMRGIDYLCSRGDIDASRIGCTGNSGGGTLSSYIMALDERVACAAPSCYLTSLSRLARTIGPQDAEQNIAGQVAFGMDHADYILMRAPKPTFMCTATHDFFDIQGSWDTFRQAKRLYTVLGFSERLDIAEAPEEHGFSLLLRQGAARWMRRWLLNIDDAVVERDAAVLTDAEIQCSPDGQVNLMTGAKTAFDFNVDKADELREVRAAFWRDIPREQALAKVRETAGIRRLAELPEPTTDMRDRIECDGYTIRKLLIQPEDGIVLPALLFLPEESKDDTYLVVDGKGKAAAADEDGAVMDLVLKGYPVLAVDLRGFGETVSDWGSGSWAETFGRDWKTSFMAYMLDRPYVAMRAEDVMVCARLAANHKSDGTPLATPRKVHLVASGQAALAGLHAAALEPGLFASVRLERYLSTYDSVVRIPEAKGQLVNAVHGALAVYDVPDLVRALPRETTTLVDPLDPTGQPAGMPQP